MVRVVVGLLSSETLGLQTAPELVDISCCHGRIGSHWPEGLAVLVGLLDWVVLFGQLGPGLSELSTGRQPCFAVSPDCGCCLP